jgi:hypothetical protein
VGVTQPFPNLVEQAGSEQWRWWSDGFHGLFITVRIYSIALSSPPGKDLRAKGEFG